jgi:hypothetical protein
MEELLKIYNEKLKLIIALKEERKKQIAKLLEEDISFERNHRYVDLKESYNFNARMEISIRNFLKDLEKIVMNGTEESMKESCGSKCLCNRSNNTI